jgi:hypothetical protein
MNPVLYIKSKQKIWAHLKNIELIGSQNERGDKLYTKTLTENLFKQISQDTLRSYKEGDGNELGDGITPGKMQALHSSSALSVNVFDYWKEIDDKSGMAKSLLIPSTQIAEVIFEKKYPIIQGNVNKPPNIDVVIEYYNGNCCAIECKFTEPFRKRQGEYGFKEKYFDGFGEWDTIPEIYKLASSISPEDRTFEKLHSAQLIKHILGLLTYYKNQKDRFKLIYLYYATFGKEGYIHDEEIAEFYKIVKKDGIIFQAISWQEFISNLFTNCTKEHDKYTKYLFERYI